MKSRWTFLEQHVVPALVCFGVAFALSATTLFQRIENLTLDERTRWRTHFDTIRPSDELALLCIDETSLHDLGRWPWNREDHGDVLRLLSCVRPSVVAWDILFTESTPADDYFAGGIPLNRSVVLGAVTDADPTEGLTPAAAAQAGLRLQPLTRVEGDRSAILTSPALAAPTGKLGALAAIGFVDTPPGSDGVRRVAPLVVRVGDQVFPSLSLATLMAYWDVPADKVVVRLGDAIELDGALGRRRIPIDASGSYMINYRHDLQGFYRYGYSQAWVELQGRFVEHRSTPIPLVSGRMLVVGQVGSGLADFGPTPFSPLTPLMLVHANIIENVLRQDYVRVVPPGWIWLGALIAGIAGLAYFSPRSPGEQAVYALGIPLAYVLAAVVLWIDGSWRLPVVGPLLGFGTLQVFMIGRRMLVELRAKEQIKGMFGTYVSPELVRRLVAAGKPPELGGHEREITAYFSDIQEFSTFSELLAPRRLVELMNEYLTACTDLVQAEGGTLDKYIGDALVAMFGAPVALPDHAYRACVSALRVQAALGELRERWRRDGGWPDIVGRMRTRIGLNTGNCVVGNMGSRTRFNYTMMGDNVNLAARMESGAKLWGAFTMCTEATRVACEARAPGQIVFRPLGRIQVKGRATAVPIFEVAGFADAITPQARECFALFSQALERYYQRDWDGAAALFRRAGELEPPPEESAGAKPNPSAVFLSIVAQFRKDPPSSGWDGVYVMKEK